MIQDSGYEDILVLSKKVLNPDAYMPLMYLISHHCTCKTLIKAFVQKEAGEG